ncbi:MAG: 23S rRNA (pseudouridine(1915)-N(3))-methyltransferase RlmH [Bacteroidetes bacterium]|nr:MAG: 23S rRNA (pseudouridine(1915)-N(3))-methyltransferase RlmH [Bacteroidota bacterium]REJ99699.1 MAG: 23S rRNA (pseudouridine(1915)-N(3))-methyltransferase RlmH [Bacteroidota bacterium]REK33932.1 MAG: 23S rRNA (pseudouridine(1915)-N(3))-methyltransferase RlmH [Bacteroidota bacterium]REK47698.1 MAG: 23S rRNA (pseudouridine(1915)-N(3))-methyltransferase RlmH [Bacteroidota bacterium]
MKCELIFVGKTSEKYLKEGIEIYISRLRHYLNVSVSYIQASQAADTSRGREEESERIIRTIKPRDLIILLDEKGRELDSVQFAEQMQKWMSRGFARILFIAGGAYGFTDELRSKADFILSASKFTFTHQMVRLIIAEQLYRAMTIIRNESYHHS